MSAGKIQVNMETVVDMVTKNISETIDSKNNELLKSLLSKFEELLDSKLAVALNGHHCDCCKNSQEHGTVSDSPSIERFADTKAIILGDSVTKDLSPRGVAHIAGEAIRIRSKGGAGPSSVLPLDLPSNEKVILHAGSNTVSKIINDKEKDNETKAAEVASEVTTKLDELRTSAGETSKIFFSSILKRGDLGDRSDKSIDKTHAIIERTNKLVKEFCAENDYQFIDNDNIKSQDLYDGVHVNERGAAKLSKNIAMAIRNTTESSESNASDNRDANLPFQKLTVERIGNRPSYLNRQKKRQSLYAGPPPPPYPYHWPSIHESYGYRPYQKQSRSSPNHSGFPRRR